MLKDLPGVVRKTVLEQSKGGKIRGLTSEASNGKITYEAELEFGARRKDLSIGQDGAIMEVEEQVALLDLPPAVKAGLERAAGKGKIVEVERITRSGVVTVYEAQVRVNGKKSEIKITPDGTQIVAPK